MLFRSPTNKPIRIALTSGHTATVGPEWRELPVLFHHHAMTSGCERSDNSVVPELTEVEPGPDAMNRVVDHDTAYRNALTAMIERDEEGDFTRDSLPNTNAVSKLCGFSARKEDVLRVFRAMKDEALAEPAA